MAKDPDCDLCEAAKITHWFHEDDVCWIAECELCSTPMVVWKDHGTEPPGDAKGSRYLLGGQECGRGVRHTHTGALSRPASQDRVPWLRDR